MFLQILLSTNCIAKYIYDLQVICNFTEIIMSLDVPMRFSQFSEGIVQIAREIQKCIFDNWK